jgi:hypothetical protein
VSASCDTGFTLYKSRFVCAWTLANLGRLGDAPPIGRMGRPFAGRTVFVVGAGPSLAGNIDDLRAHHERGHPVVCVNAAGGPLSSAGITPDVMVIRESLDLTDQIEATDARILCADVAIHPDTWTAALPRLAWYLPAYPRQIEIAYRLNEVPLFGGPAALCTAVAISMRWGAARVVLVGCDLAMAQDGTAYHPDAPRGSLRHEIVGEGDKARIQFSGDEQDDERCAASGQMVPPKTIGYREVTSHDWGAVLPTINTLWDQRTWLSIQADRHGEDVELLNATEGGAGVPGWRSTTLAEVAFRDVADSRSCGATEDPVTFDTDPRVSEAEIRAAMEHTRRSASVLEQAAREMLSRRGPDLRVLSIIDGVIAGSPMAEALAAHALLKLPGGTVEQKLRATYSVLRDAAAETQRILAGRV